MMVMTSGLRNQIPKQQPVMPPIQLPKIIACFLTIAVCQYMANLTQPYSMIGLLALTSFRWRLAVFERNGCSREHWNLNSIESVDRCTHPVPNNLSKPSVSFEVTLESNSLSHNNRRQGLYGNCQISWKEKKKRRVWLQRGRAK